MAFLAGPGLSGWAAEGNRRRAAIDDLLPTPEAVAKMKPVDSAKAAAFLQEVKFPPEFEVSIFATPPAVNYPVYVAATPDGTVYVSSDGNGSLDRKEHRGRVLRVRDLDGDGQADEVRVLVADVDSPRGLVWDHDRLYLLHPPHISEFIDRDGDGIAETNRVLVKNIAFGFKDRPADHSSNGLELGVDGWLYAAIGDFGFLQAEGTDGRKLQLRGGGVVRVRPDGTGLELYSRGTRNILEVAVSPLLDGFARDNTNDGGGWDIRFHHFTGFDDHGYPRLFRNFPQEILAPLADYGGGSGCGAAWIDEPGIPAAWNNAAFTADWGRNWVYRHGVTPQGATFTVEQKEFIGATRVTDLDVDARSRVYVASWKGATFTWAGNEVGYLVQARPKGYVPAPLPDFVKSSETELVKLLREPSHRTRREAQRMLLRRGLKRSAVRELTALSRDLQAPVASRVAAIFTLQQGLGSGSHDLLVSLTREPSIAAWALRALTDHGPDNAKVSPRPIEASLSSTDARTRREAVAALGRWHGLTGAPADGGTPQPARFSHEKLARHTRVLMPLLTDPDPVVAHTAFQVLAQLRAAEAGFALLDRKGISAAERSAALRLLQGIPETNVVDGIIERLTAEQDGGRRQGLLTALCRLYFVEGKWTGASWGTRPDTRGPFYQPEAWSLTPRIGEVLAQAIGKSDHRELAFLAGELERHRIQLPGALEKLLTAAENDATMVSVAVSQLARAETIPDRARPLLALAASHENTSPETRARAIEALSRAPWDNRALQVITEGLARLALGADRSVLNPAAEIFLESAQVEKQPAALEQEAARLGPGGRWADAALIRAADRARNKTKTASPIEQTLAQAWAAQPRRLQLIEASILANRKLLAPQITTALQDPDKSIAEAARRAARRLRIEPDANAHASKSARVGSLPAEEAVNKVLTLHGRVADGEQVFVKAGCVACHTVRADDPLKGPYLGNIATTYKRRELAEAVLLPNRSIAQGFAANRFELKNGDEVEGFVIQEAADLVTVRNIAAQELKIKATEVTRREKLEKSLMPEGLAAELTLDELASLLDYLESLAASGK
jgi:putative membrane-bound dehydrogenase-like protein